MCEYPSAFRLKCASIYQTVSVINHWSVCVCQAWANRPSVCCSAHKVYSILYAFVCERVSIGQMIFQFRRHLHQDLCCGQEYLEKWKIEFINPHQQWNVRMAQNSQQMMANSEIGMSIFSFASFAYFRERKLSDRRSLEGLREREYHKWSLGRDWLFSSVFVYILEAHVTSKIDDDFSNVKNDWETNRTPFGSTLIYRCQFLVLGIAQNIKSVWHNTVTTGSKNKNGWEWNTAEDGGKWKE